MAWWWRKAKPALEAAEHIHFVELVIEAIFGWRKWVVSILGGLLMLFIPAADPRHWSVTEVIFYALGTVAVLLVIAVAFTVLWQLLKGSIPKRRRSSAEAFEFIYDPGDNRFFIREERRDVYRIGL